MQKIDYNAIVKNAEYFKKILGKSFLCAVVKNDAYGHGIIHTSRYLAGVVDCFAVGSMQEAQAVCNFGKDVLILLPQNYEDTVSAIKSDCILTVDSFNTLAVVAQAARYCNSIARAHIKINSGMSRLGFAENEMKMLAQELLKCPQIDVQGIYSHFWSDNASDCDKQLAEFERCCNALETFLNKRLIRHIANTSGALLSPKYHLDMARIGLGLYGYGNTNLLPSKKVYANIVAMRDVKRGEIVGYGGKYVCEKDAKIAVIDMGYAQGLARTLRESLVKAGNTFCPIVAICMAMSMVDITGLNVKVGDEITLIDRDCNISNDNVIIYELLCNLH